MEYESDQMYAQEHHGHESDPTHEDENHEDPQETHEDPQETQPERQQQSSQPRSKPPPTTSSPPPPQAQNKYSNPGYQGQPPITYPHQAGYAPAYPVQAPPQNYQTQPSPQGYNTPHATSPYNPAAAAPGGYKNSTAAPMYQNGGYGGQMNQAPAPGGYKNGTAAPMYQNGGYGGQMNQAPAQGYMAQPSPYKMSGYANNTGTMAWTTGLFDCMEDPTNALITACCPCFTFGQIAEIVDSGQKTCGTTGILYAVIAAFTAVPCLISCTYRTKLRNKYDLIEVPAADCLTHCFCEWCSLCQEYRELRNRGLDPALGWYGNMMRNQNMQQQQPQVAMTPPVNQTMAGANMAR